MPIVHSWSKYELKEADAIRRHSMAQYSWITQPWIDAGIEDRMLPRLFDERGRKFPFLKDIFDYACTDGDDDDIVVYTNADIGVVSNCCFRIAIALQEIAAGYSFRRDLHKHIVALPADDDILQWHQYCGTDMFFFRIGWWKECRKEMPDMIPAREAWDPVLRVLMTDTQPGMQLAINNLCWHERHGGNNGAYWEDPKNRYTLPGQRYNLSLARVFLANRGRNPASFGIR